MKRIHFVALLCVPLLIILGLTAGFSVNAGGQTAQTGPSYHREADVTSMAEVGKLLEQLGLQMQKKQISIGGDSYDVADKGSLEISVSGGGMQIEIGYGPPRPQQTKMKTSVSYARMGRRGQTPEDLADMLTLIGKSLVSSGEFVMEDHKVAMKGTATATVRLIKSARSTPGRPPYSLTFDVVFGQKDFPLPEDEVDSVEMEKRGEFVEVAKKVTENLNAKQLTEMYNSLSQDLRAGKVSIGDQTFEIGENFGFSLSHLTATDSSSDRIRMGMNFGEVTPRERPTGPRWGGEFFDAPMKEVAEMLQKIFAAIAKDGTFSIEGNDFEAGEFATYEIGISNQNIILELRYSEPIKK
jgi:hypothetical protein